MNKQMISMVRLAIGLVQGIALYLLHDAVENGSWPKEHQIIFIPLLLIVFWIPALAVTNMGAIRKQTFAIWLLMATAVLGVLGAYDVWRRGPEIVRVGIFNQDVYPSFSLILAVSIGLFIAQSLVLAGDIERRLIASYSRYFDVAWKLAVQFIFSMSFVAAFWLVIFMGTALFGLIHITFMSDLLKHDWFNIPISAIAFNYAIDLTDVRAGLVRGIRTLKLVLLSWLLPVMAAFAGIFMIGLPFRGVTLLWNTHHASQILLGSAAWLILLVNAAYQDGTEEHRPGKTLQWSAILGAGLLLPFICLALYSLVPRIHQYGWTVNMIMVFACLVISLCYAGGYMFAVLSPGQWLKKIEITNIYTSFAILAVLLALFTPLADPARLAVADQMRRLQDGEVERDKFDYAYLKRSGDIYGERALEKLKTEAQGDAGLTDKIDRALKSNAHFPIGAQNTLPDLPMTVYPIGHALPASFIAKDWSSIPQNQHASYPFCLFNKKIACDAFIVEGEGGAQQIIVATQFDYGRNYVFGMNPQGDWSPVGSLSNLLNCSAIRDALRAGSTVPSFIPAAGRELVVAGIHIPLQTDTCPEEKK